MPNPTGSTGFGTNFIESITGEWGGRAYKDIENCFAYIESEMPFVDTDRAVALGASFGGYMMNWIAGQPLARKLKTLVCHDGIFSVYNMLASDVSSSLNTDFGGHLWDAKHKWDKWDPAQHTQNWVTPMLVIHSDKDFRCPITEGLAAFNVCQIRGIESRFLNFPDENHFVLKRENSLRWHRTVLGWINKYASNEGSGRVRLEPPISQPGRWEEKKVAKSVWARENWDEVSATLRGNLVTREVGARWEREAAETEAEWERARKEARESMERERVDKTRRETEREEKDDAPPLYKMKEEEEEERKERKEAMLPGAYKLQSPDRKSVVHCKIW